jgi:D-3-phosphoglycerate dehydrogenase / 2-oxoglutarate reductase
VKKVLVADSVDPLLIKGLRDRGWTVDYQPEIEKSDFDRSLGDCFGVVINSKTPMRKSQLESAPSLRFIARLGSGLDIIDLEQAKQHNVLVISAPEGNAQAVAEHALAMILNLFNRLSSAHKEVSQLVWDREKHRGIELKGKVIGIIGLGNNGSAFARLLKGWHTPVLAYDKYLSSFPADLDFVQKVEMKEIFEKAQIVSLHIPLTPETLYFIEEEFIRKMAQPFYLINTSRGKNVHLPALLAALESGKILGACLDVFENENPKSFSSDEFSLYAKLFSLQNVLCSPHVAGWTVESKQKIAKVLLEKIEKAGQLLV